MTEESRGVGFLERLRLGIGALFGDAAAKQTQEAVRRLDEYKRWHAFTFGTSSDGRAAGDGAAPEAPFRADLEALQQYGGPDRAAAANDLAEQLDRVEQEGQQSLAAGYAAVESRQPEQALAEAAALDGARTSIAETLQRCRSLADAQRAAQREAWDTLAGSTSAARAGRLLQVLDSLADIPQLPKPDVRAFAEPYEQAIALVLDDYQQEQSDAICFDATELARLANAAVAAAPQAEAALTQYLYDAARGYETALGKERAAQVLALLRDPAAIRDLRARRPELFEDDSFAATSAGAGVDLLALVLVTSLLAEHAPSWQPHPAMASGVTATGPIGPTGPTEPIVPVTAPADVSGWLSSVGAPSSTEIQEAVAASDTESAGTADEADDDVEDVDDEDDEDDAGDSDDGGDV